MAYLAKARLHCTVRHLWVQNLENRTLHSKVIRKNDLQKLAENLPNTPFEADNYKKGILNNFQLNMRICSMDHQHDQNLL